MIKSIAEKYKGYDLAFDSFRGLSLLLVIYHHIYSQNFLGSHKVAISILFLIITLLSVVFFEYGLNIGCFTYSGRWLDQFFLISFPSFASGILLAHLMTFNFFQKSNRMIEIIVYLAICISVYNSKTFMPMYLSAFLIVMASQLNGSWFGQFLRSKLLKPAQSIGIMCFSVYLFHLPVFYSVNYLHKQFSIEIKGDSIFLLFLSLEVLFFTVIISIFTFNYIEKRFTLWGRKVCSVK